GGRTPESVKSCFSNGKKIRVPGQLQQPVPELLTVIRVKMPGMYTCTTGNTGIWDKSVIFMDHKGVYNEQSRLRLRTMGVNVYIIIRPGKIHFINCGISSTPLLIRALVSSLPIHEIISKI